MKYNKGSNYKQATREEKILYANYVPSRYWKPAVFSFSDMSKISKKVQEQYFNLLNTKKGLLISYRVAISSFPSEEAAYNIASALTRIALFEHNLKCTWYNVAIKEPNFNDPRPNVVVLHNVMYDSLFDRWQRFKDWVHWAEDCLILMVFSGHEPQIIMDTKLRTAADLFFWSTNPIKRRKQRNV